MVVWNEEDDLLSDAVSSGDLPAIRRYLAGNGSANPEIVWSPDGDHLEDSRLAEAVTYWKGARGEDDLPDYRAFGPEELRSLLGHLAIIESAGEDFRYRLYGSYIASRYGEDRTGQRLSEKNTGMGRFFNAAYRAALARRDMLFTRHLPPRDSRVTACQRLLMPFARDGVADVLVIANLAFATDRMRYGPFGQSE